MSRRPELPIAIALGVSALAGLGLAALYVAGGQTQLEGILLTASLGGIAIALILWAKRLLPGGELTEPRPGPSPEELRASMAQTVAGGEEPIARRRLLSRALAAAGGALVLALVFPIRSLGPKPGRTLFVTPWREGVGLVNEAGDPVGVADLVVGSIITVFPEGAVGSADGQAVLIRVEEDRLRLPSERLAWTVGGHVAYSKVCTHAGCPVGLYLQARQQLLCPCHQSTFDVLRGAEPVFGPAARPLPQLPLRRRDDGTLEASGPFPEPVGPGFWNRPS